MVLVNFNQLCMPQQFSQPRSDYERVQAGPLHAVIEVLQGRVAGKTPAALLTDDFHLPESVCFYIGMGFCISYVMVIA